ncbi:hypothetical protein [Blastococcus sp. KM273128]|uniref:hypothetical protein n=1 Tax=Blastococcus sp. KM273128 TaxID=2570314 RepID=UPI001F47D4BB|nr:hypothetical protein [Blastococcus sp. KM273128]
MAEQALASAGRSSPLGVETGQVALTGSGRGRGTVDRVGQAARLNLDPPSILVGSVGL